MMIFGGSASGSVTGHFGVTPVEFNIALRVARELQVLAQGAVDNVLHLRVQRRIVELRESPHQGAPVVDERALHRAGNETLLVQAEFEPDADRHLDQRSARFDDVFDDFLIDYPEHGSDAASYAGYASMR